MKGKKRFKFSLSTAAIIAILSSIVLPTSTYAADENGEDFSLTIMHMNDTHARVEPLPNMVTAIKKFVPKSQMLCYLMQVMFFQGHSISTSFKGKRIGSFKHDGY